MKRGKSLSHERPDAGKAHVRLDEGEGAPARPWRGASFARVRKTGIALAIAIGGLVATVAGASERTLKEASFADANCDPIRMAAAIRTDGFSGARLDVELVLEHSDKATSRVAMKFMQATHDWQVQSRTFYPAKPVTKATLLAHVEGEGTAEVRNAVLSRDAPEMPALYTIPGEFDAIHGHMQGGSCDETGLYLSYDLGIFKLGWDGKLIRHVDLSRHGKHLGDVIAHDGRVYGTFCNGSMAGDAPKGMPNAKVSVWDRELTLIAEHPLPMLIDGAAVVDDVLSVGTWESKSSAWYKLTEGTVLQLRLPDFSEVARPKVRPGFLIDFNIQCMQGWKDTIFASFYPDRTSKEALPHVVQYTKDFKTILGRHWLGCSEGFGLLPQSRFPSKHPRFFRTQALGGNVQRWNRTDNRPRFRIDFYEFTEDGGFRDLTRR